MNARFWIWIHDGFVKVTLKPNQSLQHVFGGPHDEGWSSQAHKWSFDGRYVYKETIDDGSDCDGRLTRFNEFRCHILRLKDFLSSEDINPSRLSIPDWQYLNGNQRDYFAESMNF